MKVDYLVTSPLLQPRSGDHPHQELKMENQRLLLIFEEIGIRGTLDLKRGETSDLKAVDSSFLIPDLDQAPDERRRRMVVMVIAEEGGDKCRNVLRTAGWLVAWVARRCMMVF